MIVATDKWKKAVIKILGKTLSKPRGEVSFSAEIEDDLIRRGYAIAVESTLESEDLDPIEPTEESEESEEIESAEPTESEPVKSPRRNSKR